MNWVPRTCRVAQGGLKTNAIQGGTTISPERTKRFTRTSAHPEIFCAYCVPESQLLRGKVSLYEKQNPAGNIAEATG